jgi:hypothetical protein
MSRDQALRRLDKESHINAGRQLLPEAGAQRTLEAVSSRPWFGVRSSRDMELPSQP